LSKTAGTSTWEVVVQLLSLHH